MNFTAKFDDYEIELLPASSPQQLQGVKAFLVGPGDSGSSNGIILKVETPKELESSLRQFGSSSGKGLDSATKTYLRLALKPRGKKI